MSSLSSARQAPKVHGGPKTSLGSGAQTGSSCAYTIASSLEESRIISPYEKGNKTGVGPSSSVLEVQDGHNISTMPCKSFPPRLSDMNTATQELERIPTGHLRSRISIRECFSRLKPSRKTLVYSPRTAALTPSRAATMLKISKPLPARINVFSSSRPLRPLHPNKLKSITKKILSSPNVPLLVVTSPSQSSDLMGLSRFSDTESPIDKDKLFANCKASRHISLKSISSMSVKSVKLTVPPRSRRPSFPLLSHFQPGISPTSTSSSCILGEVHSIPIYQCLNPVSCDPRNHSPLCQQFPHKI
ncbi:hypothetical protein BDQ17DRAFT_1003124 [Cyathus striatus]|nr:hypothetical protein BDQ17DRAFT_1003124 [Cyathus striatus]